MRRFGRRRKRVRWIETNPEDVSPLALVINSITAVSVSGDIEPTAMSTLVKVQKFDYAAHRRTVGEWWFAKPRMPFRAGDDCQISWAQYALAKLDYGLAVLDQDEAGAIATGQLQRWDPSVTASTDLRWLYKRRIMMPLHPTDEGLSVGSVANAAAWTASCSGTQLKAINPTHLATQPLGHHDRFDVKVKRAMPAQRLLFWILKWNLFGVTAAQWNAAGGSTLNCFGSWRTAWT